MAHIPASSLWWNPQAAKVAGRAAISEARYGPGGRCGPRRQDRWQLVLLHSGSCVIQVDHKRFDVPVGSLVLLRPGHRELWEFSPGNPSHHSWCEVKVELMPESMQRGLRHAPRLVPVSPFWTRLLAIALELRDQQTPGGVGCLEHMGLALFGEFLNLAARHTDPRMSDEAVNKAIRHMQEHWREEDCMATTLAAAGLSRNVVTRRFKAARGTTPSRYLWQMRTERGVAMLRETGLTMSEIAFACGFKNPFHFSRAVKELEGHSPREIRRRAWNIEPGGVNPQPASESRVDRPAAR
jgi:AraC-like DNA-binding protein